MFKESDALWIDRVRPRDRLSSRTLTCINVFARKDFPDKCQCIYYLVCQYVVSVIDLNDSSYMVSVNFNLKKNALKFPEGCWQLLHTKTVCPQNVCTCVLFRSYILIMYLFYNNWVSDDGIPRSLTSRPFHTVSPLTCIMLRRHQLYPCN
jgi:hypothetical protein